VVIDETHTYKGAFGSHTALILRRLKRLCSHGLELHEIIPYNFVYLSFKWKCESTICFYLQYMDLFLLLFFLQQLLQILGSILWYIILGISYIFCTLGFTYFFSMFSVTWTRLFLLHACFTSYFF